MKALRYFGPHDIRYDSVPDPTLMDDRDAIVRVEACSICGSDLHIYHGHGFSSDVGFCVGHEAVGEVVEVGRAVKRLRPGDRVMMPGVTGCGLCAPCLSGDVFSCLNNAARVYGLSSGLQGSQAEALRVPAADTNAIVVPDGISADQAVLLTDALATAWFGLRNARLRPGGSVAVIGLGPIGLMAVEAALATGSGMVFAIDPIADRRALAVPGSIPLHPDEALGTITEMTRGVRVDSVLEAAGHSSTVDLAMQLVRRRGAVSVVGVQQAPTYAFPIARAFASGIHFFVGTCNVTEEWQALIPLLQHGRIAPERYISHRMALSDGAEAYRMFAARDDGALKMMLRP